MIDINELRQNIITYGLEATCADDLIGLLGRLEAAEKEIAAMKQQEPVGMVQWIKGWPVVNAYEGVVLEPNKPLYALPGAQITKDAIIDDLQSQFDTEGITEHDSGDALIRLSDAIAAVEDNFAQPAASVPEGWKLVPNEPSQEMVRVATAEYVQACSRGLHPNIAWRRAFEAMISVAPKAKGEEK